MEDEIRITVIATGFGTGEEKKLEELKRTIATPLHESDDLLDEVPAYLRGACDGGKPETTKIGTIISNFVNDEYDIPTFLRKGDELEPSEA